MLSQIGKETERGPFLHSAVSELFDFDSPLVDQGAFVGFSDDTFKMNPRQMFSRIPSTNVKETHDEFKIEVAVPGFAKQDIAIDVDSRLLTINIIKDKEDLRPGERFRRREYNYLNSSRTFLLTHVVDTNSISAKCENGLLILTLPKIAEARTFQKKKIEIS